MLVCLPRHTFVMPGGERGHDGKAEWHSSPLCEDSGCGQGLWERCKAHCCATVADAEMGGVTVSDNLASGPVSQFFFYKFLGCGRTQSLY